MCSKTSSPDVTRGFIVGCPRSGTTLLQSLLGSHSSIVTFPESHFFRKTFRGVRPRVLGGLWTSKVLREWLDKVGLSKYQSEVPLFPIRKRPVVNAFVGILDDVAYEEECTIWLEKTPGHIYVLKDIESNVYKSKFLHIIRDGRSVVASLYDASLKYPSVWKNRTLKDFVSLWNDAISESNQRVGKENHFFVHYEKLTEEPRIVLQNLCSFLSINFEESMLVDYKETSSKIVLPSEEWMKGSAEPIIPRGLYKYNACLTEEERIFVEDNLKSIPEKLSKEIFD